jgi:hypothetical protein
VKEGRTAKIAKSTKGYRISFVLFVIFGVPFNRLTLSLCRGSRRERAGEFAGCAASSDQKQKR